MLNLIQAEIYELRKSKGVKISILISTICAIGIVVMSHYVATEDLSPQVINSASALTEVIIVSLLGSLLTGIIVCSDFESKTIHDKIANSKSRSMVVISKVIVFVIMIAVLILPYIIATVIAVSLGIEFAKPFVGSVFLNILSENSGAAVSLSTMGKIIAICLVEAMVHIGRVSIFIPIAFKLKKPLAVMGTGVILPGFLDFTLGLFLNIDIVKDIISLTPYFRDYMIIPMDESISSLIKIVIVSIVFIVIMSLIAIKMFKKAEIK